MSKVRSSDKTPESDSIAGAAVLSAIVHAGALAAAFVVWPALAPPFEMPSDIVPVELEVAEATNIMPQEQAPEPIAEPEPLPMPAIQEPQPEALAEPPPPPPAEDDFALAEDKSEPSPEPKKPVPEPRFALAQPRVKPKPDRKKEEFDIDKIASLVDKIDQPQAKNDAKAIEPPKAKRAMKGAGAQTDMTASEIDAFRSQLRKCWNVPVGAPDPAALVFRVRIFLNQDGTVAAPPELIDKSGLSDPYFRAAVDSAKRAVHMCSPFQLPPEKYALWNDIEVEFDPQKMSGY